MQCGGGNVLFKTKSIAKPMMISYELNNFEEFVERINSKFSNIK